MAERAVAQREPLYTMAMELIIAAILANGLIVMSLISAKELPQILRAHMARQLLAAAKQ
jgi:hypothetical protein